MMRGIGLMGINVPSSSYWTLPYI